MSLVRISRQPQAQKMAGPLNPEARLGPSLACNQLPGAEAPARAVLLSRQGRVALVAVVLLEVVPDDERVAVIDRGPERLDHFGHFGVPHGRARKR